MKLPCYSLQTLITEQRKISAELSVVPQLIKHFHDYLKQGYYPFVSEDPLSYYERILMVVEKTIFEDIANFYHLKTENLSYFSKILNYLATIPPGEISTYNLAKNLSITDKTVANYLNILSETGLIEILYSGDPGAQALRKPEKAFLNNTNLHYALSGHFSGPIDKGTIRELAFIQLLRNAGLEIFYSKQADYRVGDVFFEIGDKHKTRAQIKDLKNAWLVKDDIVSAEAGAIPLCYVGLLY